MPYWPRSPAPSAPLVPNEPARCATPGGSSSSAHRHVVAMASMMSTLVARYAGMMAATTPTMNDTTRITIVLNTGTENTVTPSSRNDSTNRYPLTRPRMTPSTAPSRLVMTLSQLTVDHTCERVMPTARSSAISRHLSYTDSNRVMTMPTAAMTIDNASRP